MAYLLSSPPTRLNPSTGSLNLLKKSSAQFLPKSHLAPKLLAKSTNIRKISRNQFFLQCTTKFSTPTIGLASETESEYETEQEYYNSTEEEYAEGEEEEDDGPMVGKGNGQTPPLPVKRPRRRRYRKLYPGEKKGITEEMRFVAMKLRNSGKSNKENTSAVNNGESDREEKEIESEKEDNSDENNDDDGSGETWQPSMEGFLKYLVDSKLVFTTIERIVDESTDVSYVYFRKTGLERSECISRDLERLSEQGHFIPQPSNPGVSYAKYLEELAEKVSKTLLGGRELDIYKWEGVAEELLRGVREKLNALGEHWSRDEKNKCLREVTKAFRFMGQIVRLIIL